MSKMERKTNRSIVRIILSVARAWIYEPLTLLATDKRAVAGFIIVLFYVGLAVIGPMVVPLNLTPNLESAYLPPSLEHPLGTDPWGRDIFAQLVHGAPDMLIVAFLAGLITVLVGTVVGIFSGYSGGTVDLIVMTITDIVLTIPGFPLLMVIAAFLIGSGIEVNIFMAAALLSITSWAGLARSVRSQILSIKREPYIEVSQTLGLGKLHIIFSEIMPNILPYIVMNLILSMIGALYSYVGLMALGLLPYRPGNWGAMMHMAMAVSGTVTGVGSWYVLAPAAAVTILQIGLVLFSNGIDKIFNPRLREK